MEQERPQHNNLATVGIVGGGKVGKDLFSLFVESAFTRVAFVVDRDATAPAMEAARAHDIPMYVDFREALKQTHPDFVFEITGSNAVAGALSQALAGTSSQLVTHDMAYVLMRVIEDHRRKVTQSVRTDTIQTKTEIAQSLHAIGATINGIKRTTNEMHFLAVNARIEAARAGDQGRGFDVVAQQVEAAGGSVREMAQEIERVNTKMVAVSERIDLALARLA